MSVHLPERLCTRIRQADRGRCCYCQTSEANSGIPLTYDHIRPLAHAGENSFQNVCLACVSCNEFKGALIAADDPLTGEVVPLFNPRTQKWTDHFEWSSDAARVHGLTTIGRATVIALRMNRPAVVAARRRWTMAGWHPPDD